jgi:hypothetical protein
MREILIKYSKSYHELADFLYSPTPILKKSINQKIMMSLEVRDIPGAYYFNEGSLQKIQEYIKIIYEILFGNNRR